MEAGRLMYLRIYARQVLLRSIICAAIFVVCSPPLSAQQEDSVTRVIRLEILLFGHPVADKALLNRVRALEFEVLGKMHKTWSLSETLDQIESKVSNKVENETADTVAPRFEEPVRQLPPLMSRKNEINEEITAAVSLFGKGDSNSAKNLLRKVLTDSPTNSEANYNLGVILEKEGNLLEAKECFREGLRQCPDDKELGEALSEINMRLAALTVDEQKRLGTEARAAFQANDFNQAIAKLNQLLRLNPKEASTYFALGQSQLKISDKQNAKLNFQKACQLDPSNHLYRDALDEVYDSSAPGPESIATKPVGALNKMQEEPGQRIYEATHGAIGQQLRLALAAAQMLAYSNPKMARFAPAMNMLNLFFRGF